MQLRIEVGPQARQLLGITKLVRALHLVMDGRERLVLRLEGVAVAPVGTKRCRILLVVGVGGLHVAVRVVGGSRLDLVAGLAVAGVAGILLLRFAFTLTVPFALVGRLGLGLTFLVVLALLFLVVTLARGFIAKTEVAQQVAHQRRKRRLIVHAGARLRQWASGLFGELIPPHHRHGFRSGRQLAARQNLTQHELECIIHRRAALVRHARISRPLAALLQDGVEILRHAIHGRGADRLNARTLGCLEQAPGILALGHAPGMGARIMVRHAQRQRIRLSAGPGSSRNRQILGRRCERDLAFADPAAIDGKIDAKLVLPGNRAGRSAQG